MKGSDLLLAFYGDDFTGSTDAMEALANQGYRTVLFLEPPSGEMLAKFEGIRCIGVAGTSRAKSPAEMEKELRPVMERLSASGAPIVHYKTCSTFDSAPEVGSIGHAIRVSRPFFPNQRVVPLLVGAPALGRYTLFGNHFAKMKGDVYRLDRHPVMSRHPITPMDEADLRKHLSRQIDEPIGSMNILELEGAFDDVLAAYRSRLEGADTLLLLDVLDDERLSTSGGLLWETSREASQFVVGSSGIEYALVSYWRSRGMLGDTQAKSGIAAADRILAVSGSASPISRQQVETAIEQGFHGMKLTPAMIANDAEPPAAVLEEAVRRLSAGQDVVLYTALGPEDPDIEATRRLLSERGLRGNESGEFIGGQLGRWTKRIVQEAGLRRVVIAGGDTSGFVMKQLGGYGLEMLMPVSPGAPLCRMYSEDEAMDGLEIALKGGQFGSPDYFRKVKTSATP
ncbi:four-carbon acid sugar kinase family protein [Paenibacillus sp.]|uniref:four-carbon acid sugar kinase family protein n=1 Tax=Paenibacillus sp. TaxID=58172 RepID=UPI002D3B8AB7|nr:four-carbon acid sugar kinase family protein [Paenibacillus sp.]HZG55298.1 four-carbon acid sugar kinase family protein [Paenibacillus sp.]